jgi:predicted amidophosphoribosyltransferase
MKCPACGYDNREGARFCRECAAPLAHPTSCPKCGTPSERGQKFCDSCGQPIAQAANLPSPARSSLLHPSPPRREDPHVSKRARRRAEQVTVLFAEVKGSMELAEQVDPEE